MTQYNQAISPALVAAARLPGPVDTLTSRPVIQGALDRFAASQGRQLHKGVCIRPPLPGVLECCLGDDGFWHCKKLDEDCMADAPSGRWTFCPDITWRPGIDPDPKEPVQPPGFRHRRRRNQLAAAVRPVAECPDHCTYRSDLRCCQEAGQKACVCKKKEVTAPTPTIPLRPDLRDPCNYPACTRGVPGNIAACARACAAKLTARQPTAQPSRPQQEQAQLPMVPNPIVRRRWGGYPMWGGYYPPYPYYGYPMYTYPATYLYPWGWGYPGYGYYPYGWGGRFVGGFRGGASPSSAKLIAGPGGATPVPNEGARVTTFTRRSEKKSLERKIKDQINRLFA